MNVRMLSFERRAHGRLECDDCGATFEDSERGGDALYEHVCEFDAQAAADALVGPELDSATSRAFGGAT